jgi:hypothetical protein
MATMIYSKKASYGYGKPLLLMTHNEHPERIVYAHLKYT